MNWETPERIKRLAEWWEPGLVGNNEAVARPS